MKHGDNGIRDDDHREGYVDSDSVMVMVGVMVGVMLMVMVKLQYLQIMLGGLHRDQ